MQNRQYCISLNNKFTFGDDLTLYMEVGLNDLVIQIRVIESRFIDF